MEKHEHKQVKHEIGFTRDYPESLVLLLTRSILEVKGIDLCSGINIKTPKKNLHIP